MSITAVVGCQWGDEAKGKFVDYLSEKAVIVARFNGGEIQAAMFQHQSRRETGPRKN